MPVTRRRASEMPIEPSASASPRGVMPAAPVVEALDDSAAEVAVLVRLLLLARDEASGDELLVGSFLKQVSMPPDLVGPGVDIALEIFGQRRVFKPSHVTWDGRDQMCVVEVEWTVDDAASIMEK